MTARKSLRQRPGFTALHDCRLFLEVIIIFISFIKGLLMRLVVCASNTGER